MSTSFSTKSPTIKRILREAHEISSSPSSDYHAAPLETNLFEWHFTLTGPPSSAFASGIYHGRIVLPHSYPLRPPSFRFLTPSGRFEVNREICLSISGHHEESWQPAWGLRTALVALRSFMETEVKGQLGGIEAADSVRERLANESRNWICPSCGGKSNETIMMEIRRAAEACGKDDLMVEDTLPAELTLGYKDELNAAKADRENSPQDRRSAADCPDKITPSIQARDSAQSTERSLPGDLTPTAALLRDANSQSPSSPPGPSHPSPFRRSSPYWIDRAITGIAIILGYMVLRRFLAIT